MADVIGDASPLAALDWFTSLNCQMVTLSVNVHPCLSVRQPPSHITRHGRSTTLESGHGCSFTRRQLVSETRQEFTCGDGRLMAVDTNHFRAAVDRDF